MVSEENINELLVILQNIGFTKEDIEQELREKIAMNMRDFSISRSVAFGEENMHFQFNFRQDHKNNSVEMITCEAAHYFPLPIKEDTINGINTLDLEQRMKNIDWSSYFSGTIADGTLNDKARIILDDLWKLTSKDWAGKQVQDELVYKYLPFSQWDDDVKRVEGFQGFSKSYNYFYGWNIRLAWLEMSGRYATIIESLLQIDLDKVYTGYEDQLRNKLMGGKPEFDLNIPLNSPEGLTEITIPVRQSTGDFSIDEFTIKYTSYPDILHGIYNHVDTKALEEQMQRINWRDDGALFIFRKDSEPEVTAEPALISRQLFRLSEDPVGAGIADLLRLKYFIGTTFFEDTIPQTAWDTLEQLPVRTMTYSFAVKAGEAISLVSGKPVLMDNGTSASGEDQTWMQYVFDKNNCYNYTEFLNGYPDSLLEQQLRMLMPPTYLQGIKKQLLLGKTAETRSFTGKQILVRADPANKTLRVFDKNKQEIAVNFGLDPDWLSKQVTIRNKKNMEENSIQKKTIAGQKIKRKGRGL